MKQTMIKNLISIIVIMTIGGVVNAQMTAHEAAKGMARGINLGNTLEPEDEGGWNNDPAEEYLFGLYKEAGFTNVRVPIRWDKHFSTTAPFEVDPEWMDRVEEVIDWGLSRDLFIVLNCHHEKAFEDNPGDNFERYDSLWSQIATRFKDKPEKLLFEMMNEPHAVISQAEIDAFNKRVLAIIRKTNPTRNVIYSGKGWASANDMMEAAIPDAEDPHLLAYYHSYDPWNFAGEGEGTWGSSGDIQGMIDRISGVQEWSEENNIPVYIGEFGAQRNCEYNSRMFYYAKYVETALAHDQCFAEWDDGGNFQTMIREDSVWNDIKDILIYSSDSSITNIELKMVEDTVVELTWEPRSDSTLLGKVLVEKRTLDTEFTVIAEFEEVSGTTVPTKYLDMEAEIGTYSFYRLVEVYANDTVPSYPQRIYRLPTERAPYDGVIEIPGTVEAENFDVGGQFLTYNDTEPENKGGEYRLDEGVDIEARADGGYQVGYLEQGEWMEYTVNVVKAAEYQFTAFVASEKADGSFQLKFGGNTYSSHIATPSTGSWTTLTEVTGKIDLDAGEQIMRFMVKGENAFNIDKIEFAEATAIGDQALQLSLYPNPVKDALHIALNNTEINFVEVYNSNGQKLASKEVNNLITSVKVAHLNSGLYFVVVKTDNEVIKQSFVKQ